LKSGEIVRYFQKKLGWVPGFVDVLSRHNPKALESYFEMRSSVMKDIKDGGALPLRFKEILFVVLDCVTYNTEGAVAHAKAAIDEGATTEELAEALVLTAMLTGMPKFEVVGTKAFKAAEEHAHKRANKKKT